VNIDSGALDRALCLELGIPAIHEICRCGHVRRHHDRDARCILYDAEPDINPCKCTEYREKIINYPHISTSGEGMRLLAEALAAKYPEVFFSAMHPHAEGLWQVFLSIDLDADREISSTQKSQRLEMAFALAAAAALGLEVPR